ncbi:MAG: oxidoreductase family protein [Mariprofundus sp.]
MHLVDEMVLKITGAERAERGALIESLWSGYGEIVRYALSGADVKSIVLKHVMFPSSVNHPRGWHNDLAHQRKVHSYEVEMNWYRDRAGRSDNGWRVPHCYALESVGDEHLMVLEDLDASGFPRRCTSLDLPGVLACLSWLANFCFSADGKNVAAVDFQYVGGGCGMKDVAYFLGSCLSDREHEQYEAALLDEYFRMLREALQRYGKQVDPDAVEAEWRALFPLAQADFYRFLVGWMPTHWKINDYNKRVTQAVLAAL